jgi:hypothetical protein
MSTGDADGCGYGPPVTTMLAELRDIRRVAPPAAARALCTLPAVDDADAWCVPTTDAPASGSVEAVDWLRRTYGDAPGPVRIPVLTGWRLCGAELGPLADPGHVLGWRVDLAEPDRARMVVRWRIGLDAQIVTRTEPDGFVLASFVATSTRRARVVWTLLGPSHRLVTRLLLALAVRRR